MTEPQRRDIRRTIDDRVGVTDSPSSSSRHYLSSEHLWFALDNAATCRQLEAEFAGRQDFSLKHRASAMGAIQSAVAFLEALVNEIYQDCSDRNSRVSPLGKECIDLMADFWRSSRDGQQLEMLDKYQQALEFAEKQPLLSGAEPAQSVGDLIYLRNKLVHFRPAWHVHGGPDRVEMRLAKRFKPSAFMVGTSNPWFPGKALGAGAAEWACQVSQALAGLWLDRLGLPRTYEADLAYWEDSQHW